jgi:hypothetical protein
MESDAAGSFPAFFKQAMGLEQNRSSALNESNFSLLGSGRRALTPQRPYTILNRA